MLPVNEKSTASDVILNKALTKPAYYKKRIHEGLDSILLFPDPRGMVNLPRTTEALKNAEKTLENCKTTLVFLLLVKWLFVL